MSTRTTEKSETSTMAGRMIPPQMTSRSPRRVASAASYTFLRRRNAITSRVTTMANTTVAMLNRSHHSREMRAASADLVSRMDGEVLLQPAPASAATAKNARRRRARTRACLPGVLAMYPLLLRVARG